VVLPQIKYPPGYFRPLNIEYPTGYFHTVPDTNYPMGYVQVPQPLRYPQGYFHPLNTKYPVGYLQLVPDTKYPLGYITHIQYPAGYLACQNIFSRPNP
jgi:hypothetical protein